MEKPFDNKLDEQQLDALLRANFLAQDGSAEQTQNLHDMNAQIVFGAEPAVTLSPEKENAFRRRIGAVIPKNRWWLNGLLLLLPLAVLLSFLFWPKQHPSFSAAATPAVTHQEAGAPADQSPGEEPASGNSGNYFAPGAAAASSGVTVPDSSSDNDSAKSRPHPLAPYSSRTGYEPPRHMYEDAADGNDTIPVITEADRKKYAKQKKLMIDQVINGSSAIHRRAKNESYIYIPMGSFHFGDTAVISVQAFYMSQTEVSNLQYRTFLYDLVMQGRTDEYLQARVRSENWKTAVLNKAGYDKAYFTKEEYDRYPVVNVTREGAELYCKWLTTEVNKVRTAKGEPVLNDLRIPTEPEWEYAIKAGRDTALFPWYFNHSVRNTFGCFMCNIMLRPGDYSVNSKCGYLGKIETQKTVAGNALRRDDVFSCDVYAFNPNDWGAYCMIGNAAEMVWTWSMKNPKDKHAKSKGGSWRDHEDEVGIHMKSEYEYEGVTDASPYIGFRPVMTFTGKPKN